MPIPSLATGQQCRAKAKSTGIRCLNLAAYGCSTCRMHGARKRESVKVGVQHSNYKHGERTLEAQAEHRRKMHELKQIATLMKYMGFLDIARKVNLVA